MEPVRNFFIPPKGHYRFEEGIKGEIMISNSEGTTFFKKNFSDKASFKKFVNTYSSAWYKGHPLTFLFQNHMEGQKALKTGFLMLTTHIINVTIKEKTNFPYQLEDHVGSFDIFTAIVKIKRQYFSLYTKGITKESVMTSIKIDEYEGLRNRETGRLLSFKSGPPLRPRSHSI